MLSGPVFNKSCLEQALELHESPVYLSGYGLFERGGLFHSGLVAVETLAISEPAYSR